MKKIRKRYNDLSEEEYIEYVSDFLDHEYKLGDMVILINPIKAGMQVGDKGYIIGKSVWLHNINQYDIAFHDRLNPKAAEPKVRHYLPADFLPDFVNKSIINKYASFIWDRHSYMEEMGLKKENAYKKCLKATTK